MDPLSISASVLTIIAATIATVKTLNDTVGRYKGRDKTLARLQDSLNDLINTLSSLQEAASNDSPVLLLLKGSVGRCAQISREFEEAMERFSAKSKTGLRDWTKMEFMKGNINEFIDTLADYKSTIMIGLVTITMHSSRLTQQVVKEYSEMVKDTSYNLDLRLQRIDEKMTSLASYNSSSLEDSSIDLQDEKAVTMQCLQICERASFYIQSVQASQPTLQTESIRQGAAHVARQFEAQVLTQRTMAENRDKLVETIGRLQERLDSITSNGDADQDSEMRLLKEAGYLKKCLEVCEEASSQASNQAIREFVTKEDSGQVVVTARSDLFNVGMIRAKGRSSQFVGSMQDDTSQNSSKVRYEYGHGRSISGSITDDALRDLSKDRYGIAFEAVSGSLETKSMPPIRHKDTDDRGEPKLSSTNDSGEALEEQELREQKDRTDSETDRSHMTSDRLSDSPEHLNQGSSMPDFWYEERSGILESKISKSSQVPLHSTNGKTVCSTDSGYSSMVSNFHQASPGDIQKTHDSASLDSGSAAYVRSLVTTDTVSSVNPTAPGGAVEEFAELLVKDQTIRSLIKDGYKSIGPDLFEQNLRNIVKDFAVRLRSEARNGLEMSAVHLIYTYRAFIVLHIKKYLELPDGRQVTSLHELRKQKQSQYALERYLELLPGAKEISTEDQSEQNESGSDIDSELRHEEHPHLPTLEKVKLYLISSAAYSDLKQQLAESVMPYYIKYHPSSKKLDLAEIKFPSDKVVDVGEGDLVTEKIEATRPKSNEGSDVSFSQSRSIEDVEATWKAVFEMPQQNEKDRLRNIGTEQLYLKGFKPEDGKLEDILPPNKLWVTCGLASLSLALQNRWTKWRRRPVSKGQSRIEWTCACGHDLFADFNSKSVDTLNKYASILQRPQSGAEHSTPAQFSTSCLTPLPSTHLQPTTSGISMQPLQGSEGLTSLSASQTLSVAANNARDLSFLELCVNTGPHLKSLAEIDTGKISTDGALFQEIRKRYLTLRGFRSRFWLLKPAAISFVRFSLENRHRVGILQRPLALPPKSEVDAKNWIYDPCPLDGDLPIAENVFLHYLECGRSSSTLFWMLRLPLKLETSLLKSRASATFGWGIHIEEGPDFAALFKVNFLVLILSSVAAGLWNFFKHDFQGAFGFSCWIVAVLNSLLMAFIFEWKQS